MTDEELIARMRSKIIIHTDAAVWMLEAADRIEQLAVTNEALTKERDEADDLAKAAFADGASNNIRLAETSYRVKWLEAKLAKAVEALRQIADPISLSQGNVNAEIALATLEEISSPTKGADHD